MIINIKLPLMYNTGRRLVIYAKQLAPILCYNLYKIMPISLFPLETKVWTSNHKVVLSNEQKLSTSIGPMKLKEGECGRHR